jgi:hypothetical protein
MAKINNFKNLTGTFNIQAGGYEFRFNNSKLPLYAEILNLYGQKRHPNAVIGIQRHKKVANATKLCGIRGVDSRIGAVSECLQYLTGGEFLNASGDFSVKFFHCKNEELRATLAKKVNAEFTRIYKDLNPPAPKRGPGRPKGSKNKNSSTKSGSSKSSTVEVKALSAQVAQLTELVAQLVASQTTNTDSIIAGLSNDSATLPSSEVGGNIVTKL